MNLGGIIEVAWVEAGKQHDFLQPVGQGVAVDDQPARGGRWAAIFGKKDPQGLDQLWLMIERAQQMSRELDLGSLVGNADKRSRAEAIQAVCATFASAAAPKRERGMRILIRAADAFEIWVIAADAQADRCAYLAMQVCQ